jgi:hypothetical protein
MGRAQAEARMTDTVLITRPAVSPGVLDGSTGNYPDAVTVVYNGPAHLKFMSPIVSSVEAQGQNLANQKYRLDLPFSTSAGVRVNDSVEVTASVDDPGSVGLRLNVEGLFYQTGATARRFPVAVQT